MSLGNTVRHCFKINKQPGVVHTCNTSTWAAEEGGSGTECQPRLHSEFEGHMRHRLKNQNLQNDVSQEEKRMKNNLKWFVFEVDSNISEARNSVRL